MYPVRTVLMWLLDQDLSLGPKDYEDRCPKKTIRISRAYIAKLSVRGVLRSD